MINKELEDFKERARIAFANFRYSSGYGDGADARHEEDEQAIIELLGYEVYKDGDDNVFEYSFKAKEPKSIPPTKEEAEQNMAIWRGRIERYLERQPVYMKQLTEK